MVLYIESYANIWDTGFNLVPFYGYIYMQNDYSDLHIKNVCLFIDNKE